MSDGAGNLYYLNQAYQLYKANDKNNLDAGATFIKKFNRDGTKVGWHDKEHVYYRKNFQIDQNARVWLVKEIMKKPSNVMWRPSTYEYHIITLDINTGIEKNLNTKITGENVRIFSNPYKNKQYFAVLKKYSKLGDNLKIYDLKIDSRGIPKIGRLIKTLPTREMRDFNVQFTKNGFVFIKMNFEIRKGKDDFSALKKIASTTATAKLIYSAP